MRKQQGPAKADRYFVQRFGSASLAGAIERAATAERAQLFDDVVRIPVDVYELAAAKGIKVDDGEIKTSCQEGMLVPERSGFRVVLRRTATETRKRFSLAHELGHALFYTNEGDGPKHQVAILSAAERDAEERICDRFAGALLMPREEFVKLLSGLTPQSPLEVLRRLDAAARQFRVSVPACVARLRAVEIQAPPYLVMCLSEKPNPATGQDCTLRVDSCVSVGSWRSAHIWRHKSADSAGLKSALMLYRSWEKRLSATPVSGRFSLDRAEGIMPVTLGSSQGASEQVRISRITAGKWTDEIADVLAANWLYAWSHGPDRLAYVITVLAPSTAVAHGPTTAPSSLTPPCAPARPV